MATSISVPSKRPRIEANDEETRRVITRCEELWYTDGSIVIEAENTQFRVYQGILSSQSEAFRDMFSIPQPPSAHHSNDELVEGCPVVKVQDTAKDWKHVLLELFERRYISVGSSPVPFDVVAAFLRLGDKYNIAMLKKDATTRLKYDFPSTLEGIDTMVNGAMIESNEADTTFARDAVNLAREVGCIDSILPWAFQILGSSNIHEVVLEETRSDGSKVSLNSADQAIIITGWAKGLQLQQQTMKWLYGDNTLMSQLYATCEGSNCSIAIAHAVRVTVMSAPVPTIDALRTWDKDDWFGDDMLCGACLSAAEASHSEGRKTYWEKLPTLYGLPEWHDLLKDN